MSTTTVYSSTADGYLYSDNPTYSTARSGGTIDVASGDNEIFVDQQLSSGPTYILYNGYLDFDTSSIPDGDVISAVTLSLYPEGTYTYGGSPGALEAYAHDWGATLGTDDWVPGADVSAKTLLASWTGSWTAGAYRDLTSETAFKAAINKTGTTRLFLCISGFRTGTAPTGEDYYGFYTANKGDGYKPKLVIEHAAAAASALPFFADLCGGLNDDFTGGM